MLVGEDLREHLVAQHFRRRARRGDLPGELLPRHRPLPARPGLAWLVDANGRGALNSAAGKKGGEVFLELLKYTPPNVRSYNFADVNKAIQLGQAALAIQWASGARPMEDKTKSTVAGKLNKAGYTSTRKMNVAKTAERTVVHYRAPEWREDAVAVARALGISEIDVTALPNPPPLDASERNVFVIVGKEPKALSQAS